MCEIYHQRSLSKSPPSIYQMNIALNKQNDESKAMLQTPDLSLPYFCPRFTRNLQFRYVFFILFFSRALPQRMVGVLEGESGEEAVRR